MTGGDTSGDSLVASGSRSEAAPGGRISPAGEQLGPIGTSSYGGSPVGEAGDGETPGAGGNGSFGSGTYNERGNVTGPDSPAGQQIGGEAGGEGQGDDLANRLGGGDATRTGLTGAGTATGAMDADRSEGPGTGGLGGAGAGAPSSGDVGGMGGPGRNTAGSSRPNGGVSPVQAEGGSD
jgi:hypothetical protein